MDRKWIDFEAVYELASMEQLAEMLNLPIKRDKLQLRCPCPVCGGDDRTLVITPTVKSKKGSLGVFFCQKAKTGGDRIALVAHCMSLGQQDAAFFIAEQFGEESTGQSTNTVLTVSKERAKSAFDPVEFAAKLQFTDEVKALGYTEEEAKAFRIGFYRGHVYLPSIYPSGTIAGWRKLIDGKLGPAPTWLPDASNVVPLKRAAS